jgi:hypothetical protein
MSHLAVPVIGAGNLPDLTQALKALVDMPQ